MMKYWIWLSLLKGVGPVTQRKLLTHFQTPRHVYEASKGQLQSVPYINKNIITSILTHRTLSDALAILEDVNRLNIKLLLFNDELYPEYVKNSKYSPVLLYYKGTLPMLSHAIGVIGSRRCSSYGKKMAQQIGRELAELKIPIISGFAKGIDSYAQSSCLNYDGYTIGILGCGVEQCYPKEQIRLYHQILDRGGAFISSYPPRTPPHPKQFIQRNSLISAWSIELIIVEANKKSGALSTAEFSMKQEKPVYAIPHQIDHSDGMGSNNLLTKGAKAYLGIHSLSLPSNSNRHSSSKMKNYSLKEKRIIDLLSEAQSPLTITHIAQILSMSEEEILDSLITLELNGVITIQGNNVNLN